MASNVRFDMFFVNMNKLLKEILQADKIHELNEGMKESNEHFNSW